MTIDLAWWELILGVVIGNALWRLLTLGFHHLRSRRTRP